MIFNLKIKEKALNGYSDLIALWTPLQNAAEPKTTKGNVMINLENFFEEIALSILAPIFIKKTNGMPAWLLVNFL